MQHLSELQSYPLMQPFPPWQVQWNAPDSLHCFSSTYWSSWPNLACDSRGTTSHYSDGHLTYLSCVAQTTCNASPAQGTFLWAASFELNHRGDNVYFHSASDRKCFSESRCWKNDQRATKACHTGQRWKVSMTPCSNVGMTVRCTSLCPPSVCSDPLGWSRRSLRCGLVYAHQDDLMITHGSMARFARYLKVVSTVNQR